MTDIIIKEEYIQDDIDVVSLPDCQVTSETKVNSQIHKQMETEEEVKEEPLSKLVLPDPEHDNASVHIKQERPELSLEDANEGIVQNETPNIEESCSSSLGSNEGESLSNECGRVESHGSELQPLFHNNSQNPSQYEPVLYSIKRLSSFNAEALKSKEYETSQSWKILNWVPRQSDRLAYKKTVAEEQDNHKFAKLRLRYLKWLENESAGHREERLSKMRDRGKIRRGTETSEQREDRLKKMRSKQAQRLASESPEQKSHRLEQMRATAANRLAHETPEQRNARLIKMRETAAKRLANESPEKREYRLKQLRLYRSRRIAKIHHLNLQNINVSELSNVSSEQDQDLSLHETDQLCENETSGTTDFSDCSQFHQSEKEGTVEIPFMNTDQTETVDK